MKLIVANWKMNPESAQKATELFEAVKNGVIDTKNVEVVICPPFVYLPLFSGLTLGAQNVFFKEKGAFTGEVSPVMLKDLKVQYVIIGHSEARKHLNETDEIINKKVKECLLVGLTPILCIGETIEEKESGRKEEVLKKQITEGLAGVSNVNGQMSNVIIAYEPVWAIGTGHSCSSEETQEMVSAIREIIKDLYEKELSDTMRILYGGSVDSKNSNSYLAISGLSGLLIGSDSLDAQDFIKIVASAGI